MFFTYEKYSHKKILEYFNNITNMVIEISPHALERSKIRDNIKIDISKKQIENDIQSAKPQIFKLLNSYKKFIIHNETTKLNIIGEIYSTQFSNTIKFYVATVIYKELFKPKNKIDKMVFINEKNEIIIVYGF